MVVAIDGPAGAGKSTVARALADRLGFRYLDTGAMYRALTWLAMKRGLDLSDAEGLAQLAREQPVLFTEDDRVWISGTDVTSSIRSDRVDRMVPVVARHPGVREVMRNRQRELGREGNVVIEGRDIGTDALATDLRKRDAKDAERMQPAPDATEIDTTNLEVDDVVDRIEALVRERSAA